MDNPVLRMSQYRVTSILGKQQSLYDYYSAKLFLVHFLLIKNMKTKIKDRLRDIEKAKGIKILFACEAGSRAWGFPSPDSDYDVRFIYVQPMERYLSVQLPVEQLTFPINDELDISGWDLRKTLGLVCRSNAVVPEWLQSPVVYAEQGDFREELFRLCQSCFCTRSVVHHYLGITKGALTGGTGEKLKLKKVFYVVRSLLSAHWCVEKKTIPPMNIFPLMMLLSPEIREKVLSFIRVKASADEYFTIELDGDLKRWITDTLDYCSYRADEFSKKQAEWDKPDEFFRKTVMTC